MNKSDMITRHDVVMQPDGRRVVIKLFVPGEDSHTVKNRAGRLIERIMQLDEDEISRMLDDVLTRFGGRHHDLLGTFQHHYDLVQHRVPPEIELSPTARTLIGAYFSHEFAIEAAALCNPSMVEHPDQAGLEPGELRVAISLRQIGEGHISSIGFCSAVLGPGDQLRMEDRDGPLMVGQRVDATHWKNQLAAALIDAEIDNEASSYVVSVLPERFTDVEFEDVISHVPGELLARPHSQETIDRIRHIVSEDYALQFPCAVPLHQRVMWPATPAESNGMEDARFVRVLDPDGRHVYQATYTAYDGRQISGRVIFTRDLRHFEVTRMSGPAARNKGVALFPRYINGKKMALCRNDGETLGLAVRDEQHRWQLSAPLLMPHRGWDLIQVGNCGSPIETEAGWLVLTHGVGPMRRYAIGAMLLDLDDPAKVLADLPEGLIFPDEIEREGYVPNVLYSCGGLVHDGRFWMPYGASDVRIGFASMPLDALLAQMVPVGRKVSGRRGQAGRSAPGSSATAS
ncbi:glycoside hydrolase family 130 protein [Actinoplanes sp. LDG1-06]|uniref:Glycoside hydrolase family 130 protein n=1 Tax=Paractinoplanes ovalisporus TaxID=2810368 RepID=A0ABS2ASQ8_9ACTN|nr:glycoside hydrolase family 130 protein [Actinoplanes ovalisporus]MBM2622902.1 glycoside hydrolase family 130 protein [Actinoplanes ovalisporus]